MSSFAAPAGDDVDGVDASHPGRELRRRADDLDIDVDRRGDLTRRPIDRHAGHGECLTHARTHGPELEEVEEALHVIEVRRDRHFCGIEVDRRVVPQSHQGLVVQSQSLVLFEGRAKFWCLLGRVGENSFEATVLIDQLGGRLLPHSGNPGQVVTRIPAKRGVGRILARRHAGLVEDARLVIQRIVGHAALVVEHLHIRITNELITVAIPRDDHYVESRVDGPIGNGRDDVVGLESGDLANDDAEGGEEFLHDSDLLTKDLG